MDRPEREKARLKIKPIRADLDEALAALKKEKVIQEALGEHVFNHFYRSKKAEWQDYITRVHQWERDNYMGKY